MLSHSIHRDDTAKSRVRPDGRHGSRIAPRELALWLEQKLDHLATRWSSMIKARSLGQGTDVDVVIDRFTRQLVVFLPWMLSPYRESVESLWTRASELFGSIGAKRGLAAGEVIEEFQILRELVIRDLYKDPPMAGRLPLSLREILRLNRGIDRGVTHASVGHTDALFFQFFEAEGGDVELSGGDLVAEATEQLDAIDAELQEIVGHARANGYSV